MKHILTHIIIVVLLLSATFGTSSAQQTWKNSRHSVVAGIGGNIFMGDLGGGDDNGGHFFNFKDLDPGILKLSTMAGYRYRLADRLTGKFTFTFSKVAADDVNANNEARRSRNLNFKSNLLEFGIGGEYYFLREKDISRIGKDGRATSALSLLCFTSTRWAITMDNGTNCSRSAQRVRVQA